jgi:hypothetical protein
MGFTFLQKHKRGTEKMRHYRFGQMANSTEERFGTKSLIYLILASAITFYSKLINKPFSSSALIYHSSRCDWLHLEFARNSEFIYTLPQGQRRGGSLGGSTWLFWLKKKTTSIYALLPSIADNNGKRHAYSPPTGLLAVPPHSSIRQ